MPLRRSCVEIETEPWRLGRPQVTLVGDRSDSDQAAKIIQAIVRHELDIACMRSRRERSSPAGRYPTRTG